MFKKSTGVWLGLVLLISLVTVGSSCGPKEPGTPGGNGGGGGSKSYTVKGDEGTITGTVAFTGTPPAPKKIDTSADAVCGQKNPNLSTDDTVVANGKLANAFVYIKDGTLADGTKIGEYTTWPGAPTEAVLDQNGCHYVPHVMGLVVNEKIKITNSDPTQHNIHPQPTLNQEWNQTQPNGAAPIEKSFSRAEVLIPVKCNQHPWMKAYIGVTKHPFFAVSAADGTFTIKGVPPGTYTVVAWHEGPGKGTEQTKQVTIAAKGSATADFSFGAATASNPSSLEMMPALEIPVAGHH